MRFFHASKHRFRVGDRVLSLHARGLPPKLHVEPIPDPYHVYLSDVPVHPTIMYLAVARWEPWHVYEVIPVGPVSRGADHDWLAREAVVIADHGPAMKWVQTPLSPDPWNRAERSFWATISGIMGDEEGYWIWRMYQEDLKERGEFDLGAVMNYLRSLPYPPEPDRDMNIVA